MFNRMFRNTLFGTALFLVLGSTATARADASCNVLISTMRSTLDACGPGSGCTISAQHASNFYQHVSDFVDVLRPGDQIDRTINPTQAAGGVLVGPPRPAPLFNTTDFWAHGVNAGLELSF